MYYLTLKYTEQLEVLYHFTPNLKELPVSNYKLISRINMLPIYISCPVRMLECYIYIPAHLYSPLEKISERIFKSQSSGRPKFFYKQSLQSKISAKVIFTHAHGSILLVESNVDILCKKRNYVQAVHCVVMYWFILHYIIYLFILNYKLFILYIYVEMEGYAHLGIVYFPPVHPSTSFQL